ncbi:ANTAR domain-containing protein [Solihabitans fulvus]|uniref:ANTAR domain-containing protein n=1 Tax=Solihabitans fulvus TaxID=1892852 RepID=A0A5B2XDT5_9PSEU|nr:ANTAR domain-containing protein [Solihabitans fulvus]KAA2261386.1 ANTAR domain-containing protein [Solihabitans fulvus]
MVSRRASRLAQVRLWVVEAAVASARPMSVQVLCETTVARLGVTGAVVTVDNAPGRSETRHATDPLGARLAELQVTVGEGPGVDARHDGGPVLVADLDTRHSQRRWPLFAPLAVEAGAAALFTLPLCVGAIRLGTLTLHRIEAGQLDGATLADALAFAGFALTLLLDQQAGIPLAGGDPADDGLPLRSAQVHQATGMVSAQLDIGISDAFARLRARAFADRLPLNEVAADVVARRLRFGSTNDAP